MSMSCCASKQLKDDIKISAYDRNFYENDKSDYISILLK
jgi:hypothetical protein